MPLLYNKMHTVQYSMPNAMPISLLLWILNALKHVHSSLPCIKCVCESALKFVD